MFKLMKRTEPVLYARITPGFIDADSADSRSTTNKMNYDSLCCEFCEVCELSGDLWAGSHEQEVKQEARNLFRLKTSNSH